MESVVNKIIEIDRMADSRINDARKRSDEILSETEEKCRKLRNDICTAADKRIAEIEEINRSDFDFKVSELEKKYSTEKLEMDSFFDSRHTEIENSIFAEIVGE